MKKPDESALDKLRELVREWPHAEETCCVGLVCHRCQLEALLPALAEEQQTMVAATCERAAQEADWCADVKACNESTGIRIGKAIRTLSTADQRAALDKLLAQARLDTARWCKALMHGNGVPSLDDHIADLESALACPDEGRVAPAQGGE